MNRLTELYGLVLAGGRSRRMGRDKSSLCFGSENVPQWKHVSRLLAKVCPRVYLSVRRDQVLEGFNPGDADVLTDDGESAGPLSGVLTAMQTHPQKAWLVVACDLPMLTRDVLENLIAQRGTPKVVAYRSRHDGLPEPLCAVYEPAMYPLLSNHEVSGCRCPRKILIKEAEAVLLLDLQREEALENANTLEEYLRLNRQLATGSP